MFVDPLKEVREYNPFAGSGSIGSGAGSSGLKFFMGRVISNRDERMLGRIKCQIHDLLIFETKEELPWIFPLYPVGIGGGPKSSYFSVPEEESWVVVVFPYNSIYFGYYIGHSLNRQTRMIDFMSHYPERFGFQDSNENKWIIDKYKQTEERRYSDKSVGIWDSANSTYNFRDKFGTRIHIDRKNQYAFINFAGVNFRVENGTIKIEGREIFLYLYKYFKLAVKDGIYISSRVFRFLGKIFGIQASEIHTSDEKQYEQTVDHEPTGINYDNTSGVDEGLDERK